MALKYESIKEYLRAEACKPSAVRKMPTVRALARQFSVASATVSRALQELEYEHVICRRQGSGIVAVTPEARVAAIAEQCTQATSMATIVHATADYPSEHIWERNLMVEQCLRRNGYAMAPCRIQRNTTYHDILDFAASQPRCEGIIVGGMLGVVPPPELALMGKLPYRVALLDHQAYSYPRLPSNVALLAVDPAPGAELAVQYLFEQGHRQIAYVRNEPNSEYAELQQKAFRTALRKRGLECGPRRIFSEIVRNWDDAMAVAQQLVIRNLPVIREDKITALFFLSSQGAFAAVDALRQNGIRVPDEISVLGDGDSRFYQYSSPALTVLLADYLEMVNQAVEFVQKGASQNRIMLFPQHLVARRSVARLSPAPA